MAACIDNGIDFLVTLFVSGLGYSAINTRVSQRESLSLSRPCQDIAPSGMLA